MLANMISCRGELLAKATRSIDFLLLQGLRGGLR